ncbi:MAG: TfoX/Sxy family protein [Ginsengibacter sp.]
MAYNEKLAGRVREIISRKEKNIEEKKMFGGLCFMVNDKMCVGVREDSLMLRIDPGIYDDVLEEDGCRVMEFTGRVMKGFVYVDEAGLKSKTKMEHWLQRALDYNKIAKPSKKKRSKT